LRAASHGVSAPTTPSTGARAEAIDVITNALAAVSAENLSVTELRAEIDRTEHAMKLLRDAAPHNGQSLRNDFLFESGLDDSIFSGVLEKFENDSPSYNQAMRGDDYKEWDASIDTEMDSLLRHETYEPIPEDSLESWCPVRRFATEVVNTMYALKRKRDHLNRVSQYKARIVVMGNVQKAKAAASSGVPLDCFSPTCRPTTFKTQCAVAMSTGRRCRSFDVESAYLQGVLPEGRKVYVRPPPGRQTRLNGVPLVWRLKKPLYGQADAGRIWYQTARSQLVDAQSFTASDHDPCLLYKIYESGTRIDISIYVDDAWVTDNAGTEADADIALFAERFAIKVTNDPKLFLGLNVAVTPESISISSAAYIEGLATKQLTRPVADYPKLATPYASDFIKVYEAAQLREHAVSPELVKKYGTKVGALIYTSPTTRTDCSWTIGMLARCLTFPTPELDLAADRVIAYLHQHRHDAVVFERGKSVDPVAYSDSDWAVHPSTTGWIIQMAGACVAYASKRQLCISLSSTEAEVMAASAAATEIVYQRGLLREMGVVLSSPTVLYVDNTSAIALVRNAKSCVRTRHIERRFLKIRELVEAGHIELRYVNTTDNRADILTKALPRADFDRHKDGILESVSRAEG
jgi:hypothetical protein